MRLSPASQAQLPAGPRSNSCATLRGDPQLGQQREAQHGRRRAAHHRDRVPVPVVLALHGDHRPDAADLADRHLPGDVRDGLLDQHGHPAGAVDLRGPADRRRDRGAREHRAPPGDGQASQGGGLRRHRTRSAWRCWPPRFTIVAVFLPIGFMGGIIGRFFKQFGVTVAFAVLLSMFVSFTLDPMLSSVWHDPRAPRRAARPRPVAWLLRALHSALMQALEAPTSDLLRWALRRRGWPPWAGAARPSPPRFPLMPLIGTEFVPQADNRNLRAVLHAGGLVAGAHPGQGHARPRPHCASSRGALHLRHGQHRRAQGKNYATIFARLIDRASASAASGSRCDSRCASGSRASPGITVDPRRHSRLGGLRQAARRCRVQGQTCASSSGCAEQAAGRDARRCRGLVDLDSSSKPSKPTVSVDVNRELASDLGVGVAQIAAPLRPLLAGETAPPGARPTTRTTT